MTTNVTGRDGLIIAQALFEASRAMRAHKHPSWSNIADMELLLRNRYPQLAEMFEQCALLKQALKLGYEPELNVCINTQELEAWIKAHADHDKVVDIGRNEPDHRGF